MSESKESVGHPVSDWRYDNTEDEWRASYNLGDAFHYISVNLTAEPNAEFKAVRCQHCNSVRHQAVTDDQYRWGLLITMDTREGMIDLDEVSGLVKDEITAKLAAERAALRSVQGFIDAFATMENEIKQEKK